MNDKKLGILSMQEVLNYGSFLQAFGLKRIFEENGFDVSFVKVKKGRQLPGYEFERSVFKSAGRLFEHVKNGNIISWFKGRHFQKKWHQAFFDSYFKILEIEKKEHEMYDLVVIGSDEVFNCVQRIEWGFSTQFFGNIPNAKNIVSYAASFGHTTLCDILSINLQDELKKYLSSLKEISVRDQNSFDIIKQLLGYEAPINIDPVLLYDYSSYLRKRDDLKDYIIIYSYPYRIPQSESVYIRALAKKYDKKLISIGCYYTWCNESIIPQTPFEVLEYFNNADFIITDTFHGSIFSMKGHKNFCTIVRDSNKQKVRFLLDSLSMHDVIIENLRDLEQRYLRTIDYTNYDLVVSEKKREAMDYLKRVMNYADR